MNNKTSKNYTISSVKNKLIDDKLIGRRMSDKYKNNHKIGKYRKDVPILLFNTYSNQINGTQSNKLP